MFRGVMVVHARDSVAVGWRPQVGAASESLPQECFANMYVRRRLMWPNGLRVLTRTSMMILSDIGKR